MLRLLLLVLLTLPACLKAPDPSRVAGTSAPAPALPGGAGAGYEDPMAEESGPLVFPVPDTWQAQAPGFAFVLAQYELPEGGACTVTAVGGSVEENLSRWYGQFQVEDGSSADAAVTGELDGAPYPTTSVELRGTLTATRSVGGGPPREGWMLAGAAVEDTPRGTLYVKVLGPESVVRAELPAIWEAIRSLEVSG